MILKNIKNKMNNITDNKKNMKYIYEECDCDNTIGWKQTNDKKTIGTCWFDAVYMALFIPSKSRKLFINLTSEIYNIPLHILYPCINNNSHLHKDDIIKQITNKLYEQESLTGTTLHGIYPFLSLLPKKSNIIMNNSLIRNVELPIYFPTYRYYVKSIPFDLILSKESNIFMFFMSAYEDKYSVYYEYKSFKLVSILIELYKPNHLVSLVCCKNEWYLYDNELAYNNTPLKKINIDIIDNLFNFPIIKTKFYNINIKYSNIFYIYVRH